MSVFSKIKNVLFTEEDETEEIPVLSSHNEEKEVQEEVPRFKKLDFDEIATKKEEANHEVEREEERRVQIEERSPFQSFDEEEFERLAAINKSKLIERDRRAREEKEREKQRYNNTIRREIPKEEVIVEEHKFKPTPVISPVYGILDKNYTKEDILPRASSEGTLPKIMDVDKVREKAFGTLEEIESNINDDLDSIKITSFEDNNINDEDIVVTSKSRLDKFDVNDSIELPKIEASEDKSRESDDIDTSGKDDEIEKDLFNLIDSMYQSEEGDN